MPKNKKQPKKNRASSKEETHDGHAIWKGYLSFGLVNIPIVLYSAYIPQEEVHFKLLDKRKLDAIKYVRVNAETGQEVPWEEIVKGYEYEPGNYVVLDEEDLQSIAQENQKVIEIEDFVGKDQVGSLYFDKPYYLLPGTRGEKGYVLLRETLKHTKKIGIAKVMIRSHQYLAAIMPLGDAILINTLHYPNEVKNPAMVNAPHESVSHYKISKKEFDIAEQLVEAMATKWDPKRYVNAYKEELMSLIKEKIASGGKRVTKRVGENKVKQTNVIDFMDLLKKSIQQKKTSTKSSGKASGAAKDAAPKKSTRRKKG